MKRDPLKQSVALRDSLLQRQAPLAPALAHLGDAFTAQAPKPARTSLHATAPGFKHQAAGQFGRA